MSAESDANKTNPSYGYSLPPPSHGYPVAPPPGMVQDWSSGAWVPPPSGSVTVLQPYAPGYSHPYGSTIVVIPSNYEIPLGERIEENFAHSARGLAIITAVFAAVTCILASIGQGLPWVYRKLRVDIDFETCSLAFGLTSYGVKGRDCSSFPGVPTWPTPFPNDQSTVTAGDLIFNTSRGGIAPSTFLGLAASFYVLCMLFVIAFPGCTS